MANQSGAEEEKKDKGGVELTKKTEQRAVHAAAEALIRMTNQQFPSDPNDSWKHREARQVLQDAMTCLKYHKLIESYNFTTEKVT